MNKSCGCPYGCCSCGPVDDSKTDVFYHPERDEYFFLVEGASAMGPVGWCYFDGYVYLGKLGDNYLEYVGRMSLHEVQMCEFIARRSNG